jgi:hypothetical protein
MTASDYLCCFCGHQIEETNIDPCSVHVTTNERKDQLWFCHAACFRQRLTTDPEMAPIFEPAHF